MGSRVDEVDLMMSITADFSDFTNFGHDCHSTVVEDIEAAPASLTLKFCDNFI